MERLLQPFCVTENEETDSFKPVPVIVMMILILAFIAFLGFDFLHSSAHAKLVNLATNLGSVTLFIIKGKIIWSIALPMAVANSLGGFAGARLAIAKGNKFIRVFFLVVIIGILIRFCWDVFAKR